MISARMSNAMILFPLLFILPYSLTLLENCDTELDVRIKGKSYVGPLEVCWLGGNDGYRWWPVCGSDVTGNSFWSEIGAAVCRQLNYTDPSYQGM